MSSDKAEKMSAEVEAFIAALELRNAPAWRPEAGDTIMGVVIGLRMGADVGYGPYPIVVLETENGTRAVHAFHTLLREQLKVIKCDIGMRLGISYLGEQTKSALKDLTRPETYHKYFVADLDALGSGNVAQVEEGFTFDE